MLNLFLYLLLANISATEEPRTYYISATGNDSKDGTTKQTAWKSLKKINDLNLNKGDRVLLEGGVIFEGSIRLDEEDAGGFIGSYGTGRPIIYAGNETGVYVYNAGSVTISDLVLVGKGVGVNKGSGIHFYADKSSASLSDIEIKNCEVKGFHSYGILVQGDKDSKCGYANVKISGCVTVENGEAGIGSLAAYPSIAHKNFSVKDCIAHDNRGIATKTDNHSGNGIVLSGVDSFLIERCEAYENGIDCGSTGGGPVGIWVWNATNGIIQNSVSHNNHSGASPHDGGGFDIDGGSSNCIIRKCTSYSNEGAGYLVCEFGSSNPFKNNRVENNSSTNDGLKNGYGAITISGGSADYPVTTTIIRRNKIIIEKKNVVNNIPAAIFFNNNFCKGVKIEENEFEVKPGTRVLRTAENLTSEQVTFKKNTFLTSSKFLIHCDKCNADQDSDYWKNLLTALK